MNSTLKIALKIFFSVIIIATIVYLSFIAMIVTLLTSHFYAITLKDNKNPNIKLFIDWILSDEGQLLIEKTGYVPIN